MEMIFVSLVGIVLVAIVIWQVISTRNALRQIAGQKDNDKILGQRLDAFSHYVGENLNKVTDNVLRQLNEVTKRVDTRLKETADASERTHRTIGERLDNAAKVVSTVTGKLSKLEEANQRIFDVGKDIASLQEILRAPKLRGVLGELFLGDLLSQILPHEHFTLQYGFKNGTMVDAAIHFPNGLLVSVDSKFPLENFKKIVEGTDEKDREKASKVFRSDVKKHIDAIAAKYILPDEGTFDFALMYIPAENVYYEMIIKNEGAESVSQYAISKKVIPVSPNSFYIYLQAILMGFKGLQLEKNTKEILGYLSNLKTTFGKFEEDFDLVGTHLGRAKNSYEQSDKRLQHFSEKLGSVEVAGGASDSCHHERLPAGRQD